jgi:TRAP-type mannitol/chloroaromatic compound transport system permease small subunit
MSVDGSTKYVAYRSRWLVLATVFLVTAANNILWISFATINTIAASYFNKSPTDVDLLTTISFIVGLPASLSTTYLIKKTGLK